MVPVKGQAGLAIVLTLAIAAVALFVIIVAASSQDNATTTVTGKEAVHSHNLPGH
jgi:hypothetical protein